MSLLQVQNLHVQFTHGAEITHAVKGISFSVEPGEIVGVIGESGSGKSTAMRAVMGLLPKEATVSFTKCFMDSGLTDGSLINSGKQEISMLFQNPFTFLNPTVRIGRQITETIQACQRKKAKQLPKGSHKRLTKAEAEAYALELLDLAGIRQGKERMRQYPFELSGGMRQRIVLAIALACEPKLLIADEPTTALDATIQKQILERLRRIVEETETAMLLVSHDFEVIASLADRVLVMMDGQIIESGQTEDIFSCPQNPYTARLVRNAGASRPFQRKNKATEELLRAEELTRYFTAHGLPHIEPFSRQMQNNRFPLQKFSTRIHAGISRQTHLQKAVRGASFHIYRGEIYGLMGESGCGKTTLANMLTGIIEPTEGRLYYEGKLLPSIKKGRTKKQIQSIQMVFQDSYASLDPRLTIGETLEEPLIINGVSPAKTRKKRIEEMLLQVGLKPGDSKKYPHAFSGGQRQRIGIARALILEPELIVLDEPVSALDATIQEQILELLDQMQRKRGLSYFFISHNLNAVRRMSTRVSVMYAGYLVETGNTEQIYQEPWHPYTKELLQAVLTPDPRKAKRGKHVRQIQETHLPEDMPGCPYADRCPYAMDCCQKECPGVYRFEKREVMCFLYSEQHTGKRSADYRMTSQI